jgi:biopolymer transport protein ExbB
MIYGARSDGMKRQFILGAILLTASVGVSQAMAQDLPAGTKVTINYFQRFVIDGGFITWGILIPLSIITLALIIDHAWRTRASKLMNPDLLQDISIAIRRGDANTAWQLANENETFLSEVVRKGFAGAAGGRETAEYAIIEASEEQATRLFSRIEYLNIIGNVSPMIGLFGTVYGIILAFNSLAEIVHQGGVTRADQLAEGISVALVTTFWGLIIAIPALGMYGLFRNRIDAVAARTVTSVMELIRMTDDETRENLKVLSEAEQTENDK